MSERQAFLNALAKNDDDTATRLVYADWLEEHGEDDEAERQRKYPTAKEWLQEFTQSINYTDDDTGTRDTPHTYEDIIRAGHKAVSGEGYCFRTDEGADFFRGAQSDREEFFRNWSIVTGVAVPEEVVEEPNFRCAC